MTMTKLSLAVLMLLLGACEKKLYYTSSVRNDAPIVGHVINTPQVEATMLSSIYAEPNYTLKAAITNTGKTKIGWGQLHCRVLGDQDRFSTALETKFVDLQPGDTQNVTLANEATIEPKTWTCHFEGIQ